MSHAIKVVLIIFFIILSASAVTVLWYLNQIHRTYTHTSVQFEIREGQSTQEIIDNLQKTELINNELSVIFYARSQGLVFLPGTYTTPDRYTIPQLLQIFIKEQLIEKKLTIPEGFSRQQIADLLPSVGLSGETFLSLTKADEGKLFPDTYNIDDKTLESTLRTRMLDQFDKQTIGLTVSKNDIILASIVEREAKTDAERPLIAGIYKNRLRIGMALEADPTVQYAKYTNLGMAPLKDGKKNYWAPITKADYSSVKSPYNTYLNAGLPPGPICNPGIKSIKGVIGATQTEALYFFHTKQGQIITSRTLDEHNANKARYLN